VVRVVISAVLIVVLAILVSFNLTFTSSFSLFGLRVEGVPTMAIALLSFAAGVVYSLFLYLARFLHERRVRDIQSRNQDLTRREKDLADRSAAHEKAAAEAAEARSGGGQGSGDAAGTGKASAKPRSLRDRLKSLW
jgi:uncharacterized integral membrane protein